jgi:DNA polymerase elongation subunit (family B)
MKHTSRSVEFTKRFDPTLQYTYVTTIGSTCYARQRAADGSPVYVEKRYAPVLFLPAGQDEKPTDLGYDDVPLVKYKCKSINEMKDFTEEHPEAYGNIQPEYMFLADTYPKDVPHDDDKLYIYNLDIEVAKDKELGFAPVEDPFNPVTAITVKWRHMGASGVVVYGTRDYECVGSETYVRCDSEVELLKTFMTDFRGGGDYPDIITGWNVQFYDIPYLVNRIKRVIDEETASQFSPFESIATRRVILTGREMTVIDIRGLAILDYYELYRKFTYSQQESYKLDHIAHVELGKRKVTYEEHGTLQRLYEENHQKFIEYNIRDVQLVDELDAKLRLIQLVCALGYSAKVNFVDTFKQVRLWDIMVYHKLRSMKRQIPPREAREKLSQYAGGYVKEPLVGFHEWVVSFDVASMYPHIIREWNLSPETLVTQIAVGTVDDLLDGKLDRNLIPPDKALAANGVLTRKDVEGFLPNMLKTLYEERVRFKKMAGAAKKELEQVQDDMRHNGETPEQLQRVKELKRNVSAYNNQQLVRKVNLNSAYGALGSPYFRYYDTRLAEAVTLTGQLTIRWIAARINAFLNSAFKTDMDYIVASDTDSVYVRLGVVVDAYKAVKPDATKPQIVTMLDQFAAKKIQPLLRAAFDELATYLNVYTPCLAMAREVIADKGVWTAKKHYILNVHDSEGVRYETPKLKIMGIEAIKSSTPAICREWIKEALRLFLNGTQEDVWAYVNKCRADFRKGSFEDIAFPRSVNGMKKYSEAEKGIPIHVRGALTYNEYLRRQKMAHLYESIQEGEKIRFVHLRQPNPFRSHVLAATLGCPPEWEVEKYIDYDQQFEKSFVEPLNAILVCAGWAAEHQATLF